MGEAEKLEHMAHGASMDQGNVGTGNEALTAGSVPSQAKLAADAELQANPPDCEEVKADLDWQLNRRVCNQKMWEFDRQVRKMESSLEDAIADAENNPVAADGSAKSKLSSHSSSPPMVSGSIPGCTLAASGFAPGVSDTRRRRIIRSCQRRVRREQHVPWRTFL